MADNRNHDLFKLYPLTGRVQSSGTLLPVPYHVYDGNVTFVGGTASLEQVQQLLQYDPLYPIRTTKGRAIVGVWICDFTDASLGPHTELQVSLFVSRKEVKPVRNHPFILLRELVINPQVRMLVHGLWNNSQTVVNYNNDVLGLGARSIRGGVEYKSKSMNFLFNDGAQGNLIASGRFKIPSGTPITASLSLSQVMGFGGMMRMSSQRILSSQAMNRINNHATLNMTSQTYTAPDKVILEKYNEDKHKLDIRQYPYDGLAFRPKFVEHMLGFKFVYLNPHNRADSSL